jgi:sterol desaturase/sphingolipid hydroxylase (fatty acid hydroxylase superfamily)
LGFRTRHPNVKGLVHLQWIDFLYLSINQVIEYVFMLNVIQFSLQHTHVYWSVSDVSPLNTVLGLYLLFVVDDLLYAPSHYFMHWKYIYPYIHKHHHRQILPKRG